MSTNEPKSDVAIIDYHMGNMFSVQSACKHVGLSSEVTSNKNTILNAKVVVLPGVGAFNQAMQQLKQLDLIHVIKDVISQGKLFIGICLGLQLLFTESEEFGNSKGLDIISGSIKHLTHLNNSKTFKVPQIGWNKIKRRNIDWAKTCLNGIDDGEYMYFVHSYYANTADDSIVLSSTEYEGSEFCSAIQSNNVFASQFHPEKSAREGLKVYYNIAERLKGVPYDT